MEVKAQVHTIEKLKDYFFLVPDYQREYVWKADDQVEQFLADIANEFDPNPKYQSSYFIGSIILVKNGSKHDVIDGQQRLTTTVLTMCALRDLLKQQTLADPFHQQLLSTINEWLHKFDVASRQVQVRLELQYEESKDFLSNLIQGRTSDYDTPSIKKMRSAYSRITAHIGQYLNNSVEELAEYASYFLTKIELVVIESENLGSALKIFETINQRGAGLNAMDLVKNLLFSKSNASDFTKVKEKWKELSTHLESAGESDNPLRFLRYFLMARYHNGVLREEELYKWIISDEGKEKLKYEQSPLVLANELERGAKRYADLVKATELRRDGGEYPAVTRIGVINKYRSRLHLVLLLALDLSSAPSVVNHLGAQIESFFFFSNTLNIQAKYNERLFAAWATSLRGLKDDASVSAALESTMLPYLQGKLGEFKLRFLTLRHTDYDPLYRQRYVLGRIENTLLSQCHMPIKGLELIDDYQIEHILVQTPKNGEIPPRYAANGDEYKGLVSRLGNVTLLESTINQAVNNCNDLSGSWFADKQREYAKSSVLSTQLLDKDFSIGTNTAVNRLKTQFGLDSPQWDGNAIATRQQHLMELALQTWLLNGQRLDHIPIKQLPADAIPV